MSDNCAIKVKSLDKLYRLYDRPSDRLKDTFNIFGKKYHREFHALKDINFEINKGDVVGIIGNNGSGKSTLLKIIAGVLSPSQGDVWKNGRISSVLELGAGFNPELTGLENIYHNGTIMGYSRGEMEGRLEKILSFADIGEFIHQPMKTYSSGMIMRLAFAIVAHIPADILIIDEALAVGDAFFVQKCMRFLRKFRETGTILFASHDSGAVINLCHRAIWLESGILKAQGPAKEICEAYLEASYEAQQGANGVRRNVVRADKTEKNDVKTSKDQRLELLNHSAYRNDVELFFFDPEASSFGKGGAAITHVRLLNENGEPLSWVVGGESVILEICAEAVQSMTSPILGFFVKDRLGQLLFGDNTYLKTRSEPLEVDAGGTIRARFKFDMPLLSVGDYSVCVAIAEGTAANHVQHHWIHDALLFKAHASSVQNGCLVGIPMQEISLRSS